MMKDDTQRTFWGLALVAELAVAQRRKERRVRRRLSPSWLWVPRVLAGHLRVAEDGMLSLVYFWEAGRGRSLNTRLGWIPSA